LLFTFLISTTSFAGETTTPSVDNAYSKPPLFFIQNEGQLDAKVKFYEKGSGHATFFTEDGIYLYLNRPQASQGDPSGLKPKQPAGATSDLLKLSFLNSNNKIQIAAEGLRKGRVNYFVGNNRAKWRTNVSTYNAVAYRNIYENIDARFYGSSRHLEYDIIVKPGGDPGTVKFLYEGAKALHVNGRGELEIELEHGKVTQKTPYLYQEINGNKVQVEGGFKLLASTAYGFEVASYDKKQPLIIDPELQYATYFGGGGRDGANEIAVDDDGDIYIFGETSSSDFPKESPYQADLGEGYGDTFITKLSADGGSLIYSTYLGGSESKTSDYSRGMAVDSDGNVYVTGKTDSTTFPTTTGAYLESTSALYWDSFVSKISADGSELIYSTYLGNVTCDTAGGIAVDNEGNAYVTGYASTGFPVTDGAFQSARAGAAENNDAFVTKINAAGSDLVYSTYLGGSEADGGQSIAVDSEGNAYVAGTTRSSDFPTLNPYQSYFAGETDLFITKFNPAGNELVYSTYLGGSNTESVTDIALDNEGNVYITGYTRAVFPTVNPFYTGRMYRSDAFISKLGATGSTLIYSGRFGGSEGESGEGIAVDTHGYAYVVGRTTSADFPTESPLTGSGFNPTSLVSDVFVTKIHPSGNPMIYSTYLGGSDDDYGYAIAVDDDGTAFVTGTTCSTDFPLTSSAFQSTTTNPEPPNTYAYCDAFIAKISDGAPPPETDITVTDSVDPASDHQVNFGSAAVGAPSFETVTIKNTGGEDLVLGQIGLIDSVAVPFGYDHDCIEQTLASGESCTFRVFFQSSESGPFNESFDIPSNDPDTPSITVSMSGTAVDAAVPNISVSPSNIDFGGVISNSSSPSEVTVSNTGTGNLEVTDIFISTGAEFSVASGGNSPCGSFPRTIEAGGNCTVEVMFSPVETGANIQGNLTIDSDDPDTPTVNIPLSGDGLDDSIISVPAATGGTITMDVSENEGEVFSNIETHLDDDQSLNQTDKPEGFTFPDGLVSFRIDNVGPGETVNVTLTFPNIPHDARYFKVDANGFYEFPNAIIHDNSVTLMLRDTGDRTGGDSDGTGGNGTIIDPGGLAVPVKADDPGDTNTPAGTAGSDGSSGCFIGTAADLVIAR